MNACSWSIYNTIFVIICMMRPRNYGHNIRIKTIYVMEFPRPYFRSSITIFISMLISTWKIGLEFANLLVYQIHLLTRCQGNLQIFYQESNSVEAIRRLLYLYFSNPIKYYSLWSGISRPLSLLPTSSQR